MRSFLTSFFRPRNIATAWLLACATACARTEGAPAGEPKTTDAGRFVVSLTPDVTPVPLHVLHSWTVRVHSPDGRPVQGATLTLDGGMPEHAHGLPTTPEIVPASEPGAFRVEGMRFSMPGHWTLSVTAWAGGVRDTATFDVHLP